MIDLNGIHMLNYYNYVIKSYVSKNGMEVLIWYYMFIS